jgi:putative ABC transport system permease protein
MGTVREWLNRLGGTLRPRRSDNELEEELRLHLELAAEDARRRGEPATEADRAARLKVGGIPQAMEALRDQRGLPILIGWGQDLRLAFRSLRATPLVTTVVIASLALAIGANTAIFSLVNGLLLRALPVHEPERLVHVTDSVLTETGATRVRAWSYPQWDQIRRRPQLFQAAAAWSFVRFNRSAGGEAQFVEGLWASGSYFDTLGVRPVLGRTFSQLDDRPGGGPDGAVAVISYSYWQQQFGGAGDTVGRIVRLNSVPFTIVGVTPPEFFGTEIGRTFDVVVPLGTEPLVRGSDSVLDSASTNFLTIIARLRPDQSLDGAAAEVHGVQRAIRDATLEAREEDVVDRYLTAPFTVIPAGTGYSNLRRGYERPLLVIAVVVALVLLIGCVNVANLLLARAIARSHELSVQVALGASRWRLARQLLAESTVLSGCGAALGVAVARYSSGFLVGQLSTPTDVVFLDVSLDTRVLAFTVAVAAVTALLFGIAPAFRAARARPIDALKGKNRSSTERSHGLMAWLVAGQVALSVVLVGAAGLFIQSFVSLSSRKLGVKPDQVLVVTMDSERAMVDSMQRVPLYERARDAALRSPNVAAAAISFLTPVGGGGFTPRVAIAMGAWQARLDANGDVCANLISPRWFTTFGTGLVAGRDFTDGDRKGAPGVAIVNETFARKFLGASSPLRRTITVYPGTPMAMTMAIVGVAEDAIYASPHDPVPPTWYMPIAQFDIPEFPFESANLSVRAKTGSPLLLTKSIEAAIATVNPHLTLTFQPFADRIYASLTRERLMAQLAGFFGVIALLLAGLGLYGVTAYAVSRRRAEIGIRLALGAAPWGVIRLVLARMSFLVSVGILVGSTASLWGSRFVRGLIYDMPPDDATTLAGAALLLLAMAALSSWLPARRAAQIDPSVLLRED